MGDNMLVKFTVSNYKNFREPITLNFSAARDYEFNPECVRDGLLSKVIIYGNNASGKSNLGFALFDIVGLLTDKNTIVQQNDKSSFLNADCFEKCARFEYIFKHDSHYISYKYDKSAPDVICYEELQVDDELIFSYNFETKERVLAGLDRVNAGTLNFEYYENNLPVLRYIANNTNQAENSPIRFVMDFVAHMLWFRSLQENGYIGFTTGSESLHDWMMDNNLMEEFQEFLNKLADIEIKLGAVPTSSPNATKMLVEKHARNPLLFGGVASTGTRALELLFYWSKRFGEVSFLFMDEFDAFYHFDLARNVIKYVVELDNVQAVFTTHNSYLASNYLLRPDCYFVLENGRLTAFADGTDRELREGHNLEKLLRNGEFNARS